MMHQDSILKCPVCRHQTNSYMSNDLHVCFNCLDPNKHPNIDERRIKLRKRKLFRKLGDRPCTLNKLARVLGRSVKGLFSDCVYLENKGYVSLSVSHNRLIIFRRCEDE